MSSCMVIYSISVIVTLFIGIVIGYNVAADDLINHKE